MDDETALARTPLRHVVAEGDAAEVIVERAAELGADLVAMGTYDRSALGRAVMGSVARRVVQHAPCPVLTVHGRS